MRIGDDGEAADGRDVFRRTADRTAIGGKILGRLVNVVNVDITCPVRWNALALEFGRKFHQVSDADAVRLEDRIGGHALHFHF